jgi:hypothetical protein
LYTVPDRENCTEDVEDGAVGAPFDPPQLVTTSMARAMIGLLVGKGRREENIVGA